VQCRCWVGRIGARYRTRKVSWKQIKSGDGQATSKVKSPDSPQEVFAAGTALVGLDETGITVSVAGTELIAGTSFNDDDPSAIVMVTVTKVGAGGLG
jgi:hypothetical protein